MSTDLSTIGDMFKTNAYLFEKATRDIPPERWLTQPGVNSNHLLWLAGHLFVSRASALKMLGGEWSAPWESLFKRGANLTSPEQYPAPEAIQTVWRVVTDKLTTALPNASKEVLAKKAQEGSPSLDGTVGGLIAFLCLHETYHMGQLGYVRKSLGYGQTVG
jgi:uncharacterized damage-inducible protein DinB